MLNICPANCNLNCAKSASLAPTGTIHTDQSFRELTYFIFADAGLAFYSKASFIRIHKLLSRPLFDRMELLASVLLHLQIILQDTKIHVHVCVKTESCFAVVRLNSIWTIRLYSPSYCLYLPDFSNHTDREREFTGFKARICNLIFARVIKIGALCHTENHLSGN